MTTVADVHEVLTTSGQQPPEVDMVNHPPHYKALGFEVIDITERFNFNLGNALKYIMRADFKHGDDGTEDLSKAEWYVKREIERRKKASDG